MSALILVSYLFLWVIVLLQGLALLEVLRQLRQHRVASQGRLVLHDVSDPEQPLPALQGQRGTDRAAANWRDYLDKPRALVVVLSTRCKICTQVATDLRWMAKDIRKAASLLILLEGPSQEVDQLLTETGLDRRLVVLDDRGRMARNLGVRWNPGAGLIDEGRLIRAASFTEASQLASLLKERGADDVQAAR